MHPEIERKYIEKARIVSHLDNKLKWYLEDIIENGEVVGVSGGYYEDEDSWAPSLDWGGTVVAKKKYGIRIDIADDDSEADLSIKFEAAIKEAIKQGVDNEVTRLYKELSKEKEELARLYREKESACVSIVQFDSDIIELTKALRGETRVSDSNIYWNILSSGIIHGTPVDSIEGLRKIIDPDDKLSSLPNDAAEYHVYTRVRELVDEFLSDFIKLIEEERFDEAERNPLVKAIVKKGVYYSHIYANNEYLETIEKEIKDAGEALDLILEEAYVPDAIGGPYFEDYSRAIKRILHSKPTPY